MKKYQIYYDVEIFPRIGGEKKIITIKEDMEFTDRDEASKYAQLQKTQQALNGTIINFSIE